MSRQALDRLVCMERLLWVVVGLGLLSEMTGHIWIGRAAVVPATVLVMVMVADYVETFHTINGRR
jgi:hypothetical protein